MINKPPRAVECHGHDSEYIVQRNSDKKIMSDVIVLFPMDHRDLVPIIRALGFTLKADALEANWKQLDKDKADMANAEEMDD